MATLPALDYTNLESHPALKEESLTKNVSHFSGKITVDLRNAQESLSVHTEQVVNSDNKDPKRSILFLHGMRFSSQNWLDIQSVFHAASWGWRAVAIDLPGFGKTKDTLHEKHKSEFLSSLITKLGMKKPVIVSPSMSGTYSLPFLFGDGAESLDLATGFVPVAPIQTSAFVKNYINSQLPTLIVCGSKDVNIGAISNKDLGHLPKGQYAPIKDAGHACYLDNPDAFHKYLYHFLNQL